GELLVGPVDAHVDVEALAKEVDAGVGDLLLDEDLLLVGGHAGGATAPTPASRNTRWAAPTPAPSSTSWPSSASTCSRPASETAGVNGVAGTSLRSAATGRSQPK